MNYFERNIGNQCIIVDGVEYTSNNYREIYEQNSCKGLCKGIYKGLVNFLDEWFNDSETILVHTSGSTGEPKPFYVEKKRMIESACRTLSFLGINKGDSALLCMNLDYIAGKMMVVRSLVASLNLIVVEPCGNPIKELNAHIDFAAMIPLQIYNSLSDLKQREKLMSIPKIIIGGGAIDNILLESIKGFPNQIWSTYGMTETLSHIALRMLNGSKASLWYTPLNGVKVRKNYDSVLVVNDMVTCDKELVTNDICEVNDNGEFLILGRRDNIINTGGIKVQIEELEDKLRNFINIPYMITSVKDIKFGEAIVMLINESDVCKDVVSNNKVCNDAEIISICKSNLKKYEIPKYIIKVDELPYTKNGKPDRYRAREIAGELIS